MSPRPKAVVFDIGNVLIQWQPERFYDAEVGEARRRALFEAVDLHAMNDRVDEGEDFRDTIYATAEANPQFATEIRMWHDRWLELATPTIEHSVRLLRTLRAKGETVFALTNFGIGSFALAQTRYPFLTEFERAFVSGHMGVIKPHAPIFEMLEQDTGLRGADLLFTDDRADNIATAAARDWQVHRFEGPQGWADCLVSHGLLTEAEAK